jgi:diguanylate cyclase (GGDEF)-like protein
MSSRILIADDEKSVRRILELVLVKAGYDVRVVQNGDELVRAAQAQVPDLIIVDLMMPMMDGYEAIRQLRNDTRTAHLPMMILSAKSATDDLVTGFETGADDYIAKPFNIPELLARIKGLLRRAGAQPVRSPLTGLPGNILINEELRYRLGTGDPLAMLYIDLDNFKAFNDTYGPSRGDRVIRLLAELLTETFQKYGTGTEFVGHIGGDDFVLLTHPDRVHAICEALMGMFDQQVRTLYDAADLERGHLLGVDRQGIPRRFPIISVSIGVVTNLYRSFASPEEMTRVAAEMKSFAKQQSNSSFAVDGRMQSSSARTQERRGTRLPGVLLVGLEPLMRMDMSQALTATGYRVIEADDLVAADLHMARDTQLNLVVVNAQIGVAIWDFVQTVQQVDRPIPVIVLSQSAADEQMHAKFDGLQFLRQPFEIAQFLERVGLIIANAQRTEPLR